MSERKTLAINNTLVYKVRDVVGRCVGIIRDAGQVRREPDDPPFFHFGAIASNTRGFVEQENFSITGGASICPEKAAQKAIGEAIERYCAAIYVRREMPLFPYNERVVDCVDPCDFALYTEKQYVEPGFPFSPCRHDTPIRWRVAQDAMTKKECYVPAGFVYTPYRYYRREGEVPLAQPISTGLACHLDYERAAVSAICEVVERDAFTLVWQCLLSPRKIDLSSLSDLNRDRVGRLKVVGDRVDLFDVTMDSGIPTLLGTLRGSHPDSPPLVVAAASDPSAETAAAKCLEELPHTRRYVKDIFRGRDRLTRHSAYDEVESQDDHLNFWCDRAVLPLADFMYANSEVIDFRTLNDVEQVGGAAQLDSLIQAIAKIGHRILISDITTPDVAGLGFKVVRAIIPGFHPLFMGHRYRALGGHRLKEARETMKPMHKSREESFNPVPHPYP